MSGKLRYGLLIHAAVEEGRDKVMAEGVKVKLAGEAQLFVDRPQVLCEGVRVDESSVVVREQVVAGLDALLLRYADLVVAVALYKGCDVLVDGEDPDLAVLGGAPLTPSPATTLRERLTVRIQRSPSMMKSDHLRAHSSPRRQPV